MGDYAYERDTIRIERWPSERPLFAVTVVAAIAMWIVLAASIVGVVYAVMLGVLSWTLHAIMITHVRGNGVKLGPNQFPDIYSSVQRLAHAMGLDPVPDAYLMQMGGSLNAFATRFFRGHLIVLYTDLLEACGDNDAARDMIVAHELGHVRAGHLRWHWFLLPGYIIPFLGGALSRAREYTCDRIGLQGAGDKDGALVGLSILAAGATHGPKVDRRVMMEQARDLNTGWMTFGQWLGTHPPLIKRMAALDPTLAPEGLPTGAGVTRALAAVGLLIAPVVVLGYLSLSKLPAFFAEFSHQAVLALPDAQKAPFVSRDFETLRRFIDGEVAAGRGLPVDADDLEARWKAHNRFTPFPFDPFDGQPYGYEVEGLEYTIWSPGPDKEADTDDDLEYQGEARLPPPRS